MPALALLPDLAQLLARAIMHSIPGLEKVFAVLLGAAVVGRGPEQRQHHDHGDEVRVAQILRRLVGRVSRVAAGVEALPVLPGRVAPDVRVAVLAPAAEGAGACAAVGGCSAPVVAGGYGVGHTAPAGAEGVVGAAFFGVGEDAVGGDDEAVALEFRGGRDVAAWVGGGEDGGVGGLASAAVGVV